MIHYLDKIKQHTLLEKSFNYIIENNQSVNLPYHNTRHLVKVFDTALDIASLSDLTDSEIVELGIACLFHDFNHSGGKLTDSENIDIAIKEFLLFFESNEKLFEWINATNIIDMIHSTEFPKKREPITLQQRIIMDSDLIQCYDVDWFLFAIKGLSSERGVDVSRSLQDQTNFINNVTYYTKFAQNLHKEQKEGYLKRLEYLKTIF